MELCPPHFLRVRKKKNGVIDILRACTVPHLPTFTGYCLILVWGVLRCFCSFNETGGERFLKRRSSNPTMFNNLILSQKSLIIQGGVSSYNPDITGCRLKLKVTDIKAIHIGPEKNDHVGQNLRTVNRPLKPYRRSAIL